MVALPFLSLVSGLFRDPDMFASSRSWRKAGFEVDGEGAASDVMVASHPILRGYLFKRYSDKKMSLRDPKWIAWFQREVDVDNIGVQHVDLPEPAVATVQFSGRTDGHKALCASVATWLVAQGWGYLSR